MRILLNGFGRIGKLALRRLFDEGLGHHVVALNDRMGDAETHAHLLTFDTVHGRWDRDVRAEEGAVFVGDHRIGTSREASVAELDLEGIDLVIEATGAHRSEASLAPYFAAGVKRVLVAAPVKEGDALNIVYGINHTDYDADRHRVVTAASCTTNCIAPVVKVLLDNVGIRHGSITTLHDVTNTQVVVDRPHKDLRRARSALNALIPTTTGSATAIGLIFPQLSGRLNGHAVRVPLLNASLTDCTFELEREVTAEELNALFAEAEAGALSGILGLERRPLVSTDFRGDPRSVVVDGPSTMVVNGTQAKIYAWYDNEWGYSCRLVDIARMLVEG